MEKPKTRGEKLIVYTYFINLCLQYLLITASFLSSKFGITISAVLYRITKFGKFTIYEKKYFNYSLSNVFAKLLL